MEPKLKGTLFSAVVDDLQRLPSEGRTDSESLEARLDSSHLAILEGKVDAALWYGMGAYEALVETLKEIEGGGSDRYHYDQPDRFRMEIRDVSNIGDTLFKCAEGFFSELSDEGRSWVFSRPEPGVVYYHMTAPL